MASVRLQNATDNGPPASLIARLIRSTMRS
jgi:hypothetical protein